MSVNKSILPTMLFYFPNIPSSIFRFSSEDLNDKDKYLEIKEYVKSVNMNDNYWNYSVELSNFIVSLYYDKVLTMKELFNELFIDKNFTSIYKFIEHCNSKKILFRNTNIIDYMDFRMGLIKELFIYVVNNPDSKLATELDLRKINRFITLEDPSIKCNLIERYEIRVTELIIQILFNSFYEDELLELSTKITIPVLNRYSEEELICCLEKFTRYSIEPETFEIILNTYNLPDFMILYLFFEEYDGTHSNNEYIIKIKQIIKKVYEKRGI